MGLGKLSEKATIIPRNREDEADDGWKVIEAAGDDAAGLSKRVTENGSTFRSRMEIDGLATGTTERGVCLVARMHLHGMRGL